jgi:DNA-binding response OmpR family regulator
MITDAHILLVDNRPDELKLLINALRSTPWRITIAFDGAQAYQRAQALRPDIIVMDVRMPGMDGYTACRLLQANPATQSIPIIFLTSAGALKNRLEGLDIGGVDYIVKPFEPAEVVARIRVHLKNSRPPRARPDDPFTPETGDPLVRAAVKHLSENLRNPPTLPRLASLLGTNEKRLSKAFREALGQTVFEYMREQRLQLSRKLLAETAMSITAVADETGFSTAANFATAFRERFGLTPWAWRSLHDAPPPPADVKN